MADLAIQHMIKAKQELNGYPYLQTLIDDVIKDISDIVKITPIKTKSKPQKIKVSNLLDSTLFIPEKVGSVKSKNIISSLRNGTLEITRTYIDGAYCSTNNDVLTSLKEHSKLDKTILDCHIWVSN